MNNKNIGIRHIVWVSDAPLSEALHATCFINITKELRKMGIHITLISPGDQSGEVYVRGEKVLFLNIPEIYFLRQLIYHIQVLNLIRKQYREIDVILFNEMSALWLALVQLTKKVLVRKKPVMVLDTRTLPMFREDKAKLKDIIRARFALLMNTFGNIWFEGRTTITTRMAEALKIPDKKLLGIWTSGVDVEKFHVVPDTRKWPVKGDIVRLIYIGCMHYERNLMTLCRAVVQANKMGMKYHLTIVGDGSEKHDLEAYASDIPEIDILSPVPQDQIVDYLSNAHVGVLPFPDELKFQVSSPIKLFEYMAAGLPIFATDIVCHTDVIKSRKCAFWVKTSDEQGLLQALIEIWDQQDQFEAMGKISLETSYEWTWKVSAQNLLNALSNGVNK